MRKLLVWDGDETLWDGTLLYGEQAVISRDRMALCEELSERGVLQSIASFNRENDVAEVIARYGLDRWFLHTRTSVDASVSKADMVRDIVAAYGLTSFADVAFVDDDPMNRALVAETCDGVVTAHPSDVGLLVEREFTKPSYTPEDRLRVRRYQADIKRAEAERAYTADRTAFLKSCQIEMLIRLAGPADADRAVDLVARAHRMSALAEAYTREELLERVGRGQVYVADVADRFGDYGLTAVALVRRRRAEVVIDGLVISCRLQGRGIGSALLGWIINTVTVGEVLARWVETPYNAGMRALYAWYQFEMTTTDDGCVLARRAATRVETPDWVTVREGMA